MGFPGLSAIKSVAKTVQKTVRDTTTKVTKGTPFEGIGSALTKMTYKDPVGSVVKVAAQAAPIVATAALNPGGLAALGAQAQQVATKFALEAPKAVEDAAKSAVVNQLVSIGSNSSPAAKSEPAKPLPVLQTAPQNKGAETLTVTATVSAKKGGILEAILSLFGLA